SRNEGLTVLLSSHHLHQVQQICDRVGLFVRGELIACGDVAGLAEQLDDDGSVTVEIEASGWTPALAEQLASLEGVIEYRGPEQAAADSGDTCHAVLICSGDRTSQAAKTVIESGARLQAIRRKQYGLDDIYHRYFEGGGSHERNNR
ncbi:MAG: transporter ATP-binding protein, partial [Paenibacillus sp.]|nr:transporter ATP-binding protein [Paenibacillus sp.]